MFIWRISMSHETWNMRLDGQTCNECCNLLKIIFVNGFLFDFYNQHIKTGNELGRWLTKVLISNHLCIGLFYLLSFIFCIGRFTYRHKIWISAFLTFFFCNNSLEIKNTSILLKNHVETPYLNNCPAGKSI